MVQSEQHARQVSDDHHIQQECSILTASSLTFQWLAIPFIQCELDEYTKMHNTTARRANKHKILPHGIPQQMFRFPSTVKAYDFKVQPLCTYI